MPDLLICVDRKDFPADIPHAFYLPNSSPVLLCGPVEVLNKPRFTLLNSRQSPRFTKASLWIKRTLEVLDGLNPNEVAIITSLGTPAWDFLTWAAGQRGFPLALVFPAGSAQNFIVARTKVMLDLGLERRPVLALRPVRLGRKKPSGDDQILRDRWVLALSHTLLPVSLRPQGNFENLLQHSQLTAERVHNVHRVLFDPGLPAKTPLAIGQIRLPENWAADDYLIHWTHTWIGPYPEETKAQYFERLLQGSGELATGLEVLKHILSTGTLCASAKLVRGGYPVTPFTVCPPQELPKLIQWRSGLRRWTFEPYGLALSRARLTALGARPVIYGDSETFDSLPEGDRPFFQIAKSGLLDWRKEQEWRVLGDVKLSDFRENEVTILVRSEPETEVIRKNYPWLVITLT